MKNIFLCASVLVLAVSCSDKYFDVDMTDYLTGNKAADMVDNDPEYLSSYVQGLYSQMVQFNAGNTGGREHDDFGMLSCLMIGDWMAGDIVLHGMSSWGVDDYRFDYRNSNYKRPYQFWSTFYTLINNSNTIIDFFKTGVDPTNVSSRGYLGQAYAVRALSYLYLLMFFQDPTNADGSFNHSAKGVPVVYASRDAKSIETISERQGRSTVGAVCEHIEENLNEALKLLDGYTRPSKIMIDKKVACGIAARYYAWTQQWEKVAELAAEARQGYTLMDETRLHAGFKDIEDSEVMWGFNHTAETQTTYASFFSQMSSECTGYAGLDQMGKMIDRSLYESIPNSDYRKSLFNGPNGGEVCKENPSAVASSKAYANRKFGYDSQWLQDYIYMRAAEMYLLEAEAYARLDKTSEAQSVMSQLMTLRDPAWNKTATVDEILLQRRIELWGEGFSFFDRRRTSQGIIRSYTGTNHNIEVLTKIVDVPAHHKYWLFQIPERELQENSFIKAEDQNEL
ncbi:MAG: RagB/SusD family nutrient uptake outer membrane protein [Candidatus Cryptobacteroides sp.]